MQFSPIPEPTTPVREPVRIGNVYSARGGRAGSLGWMHIVVAITEAGLCPCLVVDRAGNIVSTTQYGAHYLNDLQPKGYVPNLDTLTLEIQPIE